MTVPLTPPSSAVLTSLPLVLLPFGSSPDTRNDLEPASGLFDFYFTGGLDPFFDMTMDFLYSCS